MSGSPQKNVCGPQHLVFYSWKVSFLQMWRLRRGKSAEVTWQTGSRVRPTRPYGHGHLSLHLCSLAWRLPPTPDVSTNCPLSRDGTRGRCRGKLGLSPCSLRHSFRSVGKSFPCKKEKGLWTRWYFRPAAKAPNVC